MDSPVLVDRYIMGKELEVDAICDGKDVFIPGIMEHIERTGIHSGDSISVYPTFSVSQNEIPHIEKFGLQLIVIRGAKNIRSKYQLATGKAMIDNRHNDTPVWSYM